MISVVIVSKDEPSLDDTLEEVTTQLACLAESGLPGEAIVVDASSGRLDSIRRRHPQVRWIDYRQPDGVSVTIAHQRNVGIAASRGRVVAFTDSGCRPRPDWLARLVGPVLAGEEHVVAGATVGSSHRLYDSLGVATSGPRYLRECPTVNLAVDRSVFDRVGGFDESFRYGSDVDLSWRMVDCGYRLRRGHDAVVEVDWGGWRRQLRRSYAYGRARVTLYRHHPRRLRRILADDPVVVVWPLYLLGLPIALKRPEYLLLLCIPAWRNRDRGPFRVIVNHSAYAAGAIVEAVRG